MPATSFNNYMIVTVESVASLGGLCTGCMLRSVIVITCTGVSTKLTEFYKTIIVLRDCH